jgi:NAD(P)-dependent dehydrogenase (short-subunit alcohol dehydrogenase family)
MDQHIVVTGAGRGIGRAIALAFGALKYHVLCISRSDNCHRTCDEISSSGGRADFLQVDLSRFAEVEQSVSFWLSESGANRVTAILAASELGPRGPLSTLDLTAWQHTMDVNVLGNLAVVKAALPIMQESGYGRILALGGGGAAYAYPVFPAYACSKTAMVREIENLQEDLKGHPDIVAVCVAPGAVETDMLAAVRATGAEVRTLTDISEIVRFAIAFAQQQPQPIAGRFVHVRDDWQPLFQSDTASPELGKDHWKLRRIE